MRYCVLQLVGDVLMGQPVSTPQFHGDGWGATFKRWETDNLNEARAVAAERRPAYVVVLPDEVPT